MDKLEFLATVAGKLSAYPMSPEDIELGVASVKGFLDKLSDADFAQDPPTDKDAEDIAKDLYEKYLKEKEAKEAEAAAQEAQFSSLEADAEITDGVNSLSYDDAEAGVIPEIDLFEQSAEEFSDSAEKTAEDAEPPAPEEILGQLHAEEETAEPKITTDEEFFEMLAKEAEGERSEQARIEELELKALAIANKEEPETVAQVLSQDEKLQEIVTQSDIAEEFDPIDTAFDPAVRPDEAFEEAQITRVFTETDEISREFKVRTDTLKTVEETDTPAKTKKEYQPKEKVKGGPLYWTVVILTFPIWFPIFLLISAIFGVMYVAVTALIIAVAVIMIACVALGTGLALIGIIYGVTECFNTVPIGLFEIGMGVAIGGITMLVSVLLKYLSVNCMPKLYKLIARFGRLVYGGIGKLSIKLKKECGKNK